jgi:predicted ATP-dependent serine protease
MICVCGTKYPDTKFQCPICKRFSFARNSVEVSSMVKRLSEADDISLDRLQSGPWDICFGPANEREKNGIVRTSATLIGGLAGAGKSTLSLQLSDRLCTTQKRDGLYICSEEDIPEVRLRAERIKIKNLDKICCVSTMTSSEALAQLENIIIDVKPCAIILDSLPGLMGEDHLAAVELCKLLKAFAIKYKAPVIIIDHVTKADDFAGLYKLQHTVDTTMTLYPTDENPNIRILETLKNRFGQAFVNVNLEMTEKGLVYISPPKDD